MGAQNFASQSSPKWGLSVPNVAFWTMIIGQEEVVSTIFRQPKFSLGNCFPCDDATNGVPPAI